jgi:hypothetical protein
MAMPAAKSKETSAVQLERIKDSEITIPIVGLTPVIPHQWAEKAKRMMRQNQAAGDVRRTKPKREPKIMEEEAEAAMYRLPDGRPGMPATAFKGAMVAACRFFNGIPMTEGRLMIFIRGEGPDQLVPLSGTEKVREDMPRNATGVVDLRYRTALLAGVEGIEPWRADVTIVYPPALITASAILALLDAAGRVGIGDWRPGSPKSNTGTFGTFRVDDSRMAASDD